MKNTIIAIFMLLMLATLSAIAQEAQPANTNNNEDFNRHFQEVVRLNADIPDFKKMKPGDSYRLPDGTVDSLDTSDIHGIWGRELWKSYLAAESTTTKGQGPVVYTSNDGPVRNSTAATLWKDYNWLLPWILLGLILLLGIWRLILSLVDPVPDFGDEDKEKKDEEFELSKDPVLSGAAYVPFGIQPENKRQLEEFMNFMAMAEYEAMEPKNKIERPIRIGPIEQGMVSGTGFVGYLGGLKKPRRIKEPIRAYRAMYQFQDGSRFSLVCLQGCMNPVYSQGDIYEGFTFIPDPIKQPDEECRGKNVASEMEDDFFGETIPIKSTPTYPISEGTSSSIMDAIAQVPEHQYCSGGQSGGHRARRYQKNSRQFFDEF